MMILKLNKLIPISLIFLGLFLVMVGTVRVTFAQINTGFPGIDSSTLIAALEPEQPQANSTTTIILKSYQINLDKAAIAWTTNGRVIKSGIGQKRIEVKTGELGSTLYVTAVVFAADGTRAEKGIEIIPAAMDIIWEAETYVPPFYEGKALYGYGSTVKLMALPALYRNGKKIDDSNLIYKWILNTKILGEYSGYGKNYAVISPPLLSTQIKVEVEARTTDDRQRVNRVFTLNQVPPKVLVYENNPLYGILFHKAVGDLTLKSNEVTLSAVPYFFSTENRTSSTIDYTWQINNNILSDLNNKKDATFRNESGTSGLSKISISVKNLSNLLQSGDVDLTIKYGQ